MDDQKQDHPSEEDIPSDFFDDFNKDEFIQGLSVIDSWDDDEQSARKRDAAPAMERRRIDPEALGNVRDLREIIDGKETSIEDKQEKWHESPRRQQTEARRRSSSTSRLDSYILPGSRRDPNKTNEAIKRDKEIKMKEHLAKQLESNDDIRPPGTELDDFFENTRSEERRKNAEQSEEKYLPKWNRQRQHQQHYSPPRRSPRRYQQYDRRVMRTSPNRRSPYRRSPPHRRSPYRRSPYRRSPPRRSPHRPQWRYSPYKKIKKFTRFSPYRQNKDWSPPVRPRRSRSRSVGFRDDFLYPKPCSQSNYPTNSMDSSYHTMEGQEYGAPGPDEIPVNSSEYSYQQEQVYPSYPTNYEYGSQPSSSVNSVPQPVPAPSLTMGLSAKPGLNIVPPPQIIASTAQVPSQLQINTPMPTSNDPLAQLVAEGKLTHEDYLKLAPNKGSAIPIDTQAKVTVLKRCNQAISELDKLALPTRLLINDSVIGVEQKCLAPKFCSPLKRQETVEFQFTRATVSATARQNKQIVDNIIAAVGLEKIVAKKRAPKNTTDAAVQTSKPFCDVCEIRNSTKCSTVGVSTQPEYFSASVHTQVVEQDLISSRSVFNPTGSANNPTMSIAHLTPAQLVSQLAARAKTFKQSPDPGQYSRHEPHYDGRGQPGRQYHENYSNYRY